MHRMLINLVVFTIIGGLIGWLLGKLLAIPAVVYKNYRLKRQMKRATKEIDEIFAATAQWN